MMSWRRAGVSVAVVAGVALLLSGCASSGVTGSSMASTENITPIQNMPVASASLPPIGQDGQVAQQPGSLSAPGQPTDLTQPGTLGTATAAFPAQQQPGLPGQQPVLGQQPTQVASADSGSFVTLDSVGPVPSAPGRDLSTGLSIEKLLGGWTVVSGAEQCKLNLTYTAKTGTSRYRASSPGCSLSGLNVVASWQLLGSQVQLYDENGDIIASMILSGDRFVGTLAGGQGITMVG